MKRHFRKLINLKFADLTTVTLNLSPCSRSRSSSSAGGGGAAIEEEYYVDLADIDLRAQVSGTSFTSGNMKC